MEDDTIQIRARGWNYFLEEQIELRWDSPLHRWFPSGADDFLDWIWKFFQFIFPLDDPRLFRPGAVETLSDGELATLSRYLSHAEDLAATTVLTARSGYEVSQKTPDSNIVISETRSPRDATVGFLTMLRQCYSSKEAASFKRTYDLLAKAARDDPAALETLKNWRRAHNMLRVNHVDHLILVRAAEVGLVSPHVARDNGHQPDKVESPETMLSTVFYGDVIHWGNRRTALDVWNQAHGVITMKREFDSLRAAVHLGHLYVGFAALIGLSLGAFGPQEI
jgi:hypothetical protein